MTSNLETLQPHSVWAHFAAICAIPHPSQQEATLRERIIEWARARGIRHENV